MRAQAVPLIFSYDGVFANDFHLEVAV